MGQVKAHSIVFGGISLLLGSSLQQYVLAYVDTGSEYLGRRMKDADACDERYRADG